MRRRRWPWVLLALVAALFGHQIYDTRPRPSQAEQAAEQAARRAADPTTAPAEAARLAALQELVAVSAAPDPILQADEYWLENRLDAYDELSPETAVDTPGRTAALRQQTDLWRAAIAKRLDAEHLAQQCAYQAPYASCSVKSAGEVEGSGGALRFQVAGLYLTDGAGPEADAQFERNERAAAQDPMVGGYLGIFAADQAGGWRLVLAAAHPETVPKQVPTPAGPLLVQTTDPRGPPNLYAMVGGRWRYLYQAAWMTSLAARAPPGSCLGGGFYAGAWPWPARLLPELSRLPLDLATFTHQARFYADGAVVATATATVGQEEDEIVLLSADVRQTAKPSLLATLFDGCQQ